MGVRKGRRASDNPMEASSARHSLKVVVGKRCSKAFSPGEIEACHSHISDRQQSVKEPSRQ